MIDDEAFDIRAIIEAAERNSKLTSTSTDSPIWQHTGSVEVFPGTYAPVIDANLEPQFMFWGFPHIMNGKPPLINARSETAAEKKTFSSAMASRRCLVPASAFYEWKSTGQKQKDRYEFRLPERESMYMAGIYTEDGKFAILTRAASPSVVNIHDRMPVIIPSNYNDAWLRDTPAIILEALTELHSQQIPSKTNLSSQMTLFQ